MLKCWHNLCRECLLGHVSMCQNTRQPATCVECRDGGADPAAPKWLLKFPAVKAEEGDSAGVSTDEQSPEYWENLAQSVGIGAKIIATIAVLRDVLQREPDAKFVIFSHFPGFIRRIGAALDAAHISFCVIDGSTTLARRSKLIDRFQCADANLRVCIMSSRAGNAGLTLTAANHMILVEPALNPSLEKQAMSRVHRFGQAKPVTVHQLVATDTIEAKICELRDSGAFDGATLDSAMESRSSLASQQGTKINNLTQLLTFDPRGN